MGPVKETPAGTPAELREWVLREADEAEVKFIKLWFTDVVGRLKSFAITREELDDALAHGMGFDGSSVTGFNAIEESDMIAMPDPSTFRMLPRQSGERSVARMFCDVRTPDGDPYEADSRHVLRGAIDRMQSLGFDSFKIGPELEFFLFRMDADGTPHTLDGGGYFEETTADAAVELRKKIVLALEEMGIPVEYFHHEVGPSQHEIDIRYADALTMADHCMTYRSMVKEVAQANGVYATFMPKPLFGENGSGMHTHQSLFIGGSNAFFDADDPWYLSDVAKSFIAGQLRHAREISLLFAQWVNSYKRLVPGYEAPVYVAWSRRNRSALIRVPLYHPGKEKATRAEIRCPDPSCNPYLAFAGAAPRRPRGHRARLRAARSDGDQPLRADDARAAVAGHRVAARVAGRGDRGGRGVRAGREGARPGAARPAGRAEAPRVGRVPRAAHAVGAGPVSEGAVAEENGVRPLRCLRN